MLVFVFLCQVQEPVVLVEWNGREIGIDSDEAESRIGRTMMKQVFDNIHEPTSYLLASVVFGYSEPAYLDSGITASVKS